MLQAGGQDVEGVDDVAGSVVASLKSEVVLLAVVRALDGGAPSYSFSQTRDARGISQMKRGLISGLRWTLRLGQVVACGQRRPFCGAGQTKRR